MKALSILVVGSGMYVCGRGTLGYGTIIPALYEWRRNNSISYLYLASASPKGIKLARRKLGELARSMNIDVPIRYFPKGRQIDGKCYKQAIDEIPKPACAIISVPDYLHKEIAAYAIKSGLHTLIVKPLAPTLREVGVLLKLQKKAGVHCVVEFHKRLDVANLKLKDAITQGSIGDPLYFVIEYSQRRNIPVVHFKKWIGTTNVFQYLGIHYVDIIYYVTGAAPVRALAVGQRNLLNSLGINAYDSIQAIIEWRMPKGNTFTSTIITNWIDPNRTSAMSDQKIKVIGTKGRFESDQKNRGIYIVNDKAGVEEPNPYFCASYGRLGSVSYRGYGIDSVHQFLNDVESIERGEMQVSDLEGKRPTFRQSIVSTAVLEAVNKSLENRSKWVAVGGIG